MTARMKMVDALCPLCRSEKREPVFEACDRLKLAPGKFPVVLCLVCGTAYTSPRPADDELGKCYPGEYWGGRQRGVREVVRAIEERLKENYKIAAVARAGILSGRILDVGCGRGEFLALMRERGFEVEGIEPGAEGARRGREDFGIDITHGTLDGASLPVGRYDAVTMWHVLEHLPEPLSALRAINRALALGGVLVVALPDFGSWQAVRFCERWFGVDAPRHLTHFTRASLGMMLAKAGFSEPAFAPAGARYETAMLVRSLWPGLNYRKLDALEKDLPSKYFYKMGQMALDIGLLPAGAFISASGRGVAFTAHASKISPAVF